MALLEVGARMDWASSVVHLLGERHHRTPASQLRALRQRQRLRHQGSHPPLSNVWPDNQHPGSRSPEDKDLNKTPPHSLHGGSGNASAESQSGSSTKSSGSVDLGSRDLDIKTPETQRPNYSTSLVIARVESVPDVKFCNKQTEEERGSQQRSVERESLGGHGIVSEDLHSSHQSLPSQHKAPCLVQLSSSQSCQDVGQQSQADRDQSSISRSHGDLCPSRHRGSLHGNRHVHWSPEQDDVQRNVRCHVQRNPLALPGATEIDRSKDAMGEAENGEVPRWVSQWAALTKQPSSDSPAMAGQELADSPDSKGSRDKPPNGLNRKRPGTGRRLPSIPTDKSPVSSEYSSRVSGSPLSREVTPHQDPGAGGDAGRSKNVTISNQVNVTQYSAQSSEPTSGRSGSIDTELLLRDTEELMAAMEARMATRKPMGSRGSLRQSSGEASVNESDSDTASNVALVNGDEDYVKPSVYKSPRESLGGRSSSDAAAKPRGGIRSAGLARESFAARAVKNRHSFPAADTVVVSDVLSESEVADTESMRSDLSANSDIESNGGFSRRGSKGKGTGTMSMTRPNRAFALRRARADGGEPETPKSAASTGTGVTGASTRRSSLTSTTQRTGRSTTRSTAVDSAKTETSLGAQIAKRGRENASLTRTDGGRHSLRTGKSGPAQPSSLTAPTVSSQRKSELRNLKSQLKTSSGSKGLSVRGTSARSQSQPGSRSNSPKTAERNAWERRKRYDPMKAVAEAKAKAKQGGRPGSGVSSTSSRKRMTRSASFTNSEELSSRDRYAESADEMSYTSGTETTGSSRLLSSHRRAFLPIHPRHQDPFSADEDDSRPYPHSSQDVSCMLVGLSHASAFTPPLPKSKSPSPDKPPSPLPRLHTLDPSDGQERQHLHNGSSSPQSYDNLIVLSVHQLSSKIMEAMERTLDRLKANNRISETPSPLDDLLSNSGRSEIPAWKAANQDLAGILRHLRRIEQNLKVFDQALFPDDGTSTEASGLSTHRHSQEIQRIRGELAGFHPIHHPRTTMPVDDDEGSPELAQLGDDFY